MTRHFSVFQSQIFNVLSSEVEASRCMSLVHAKPKHALSWPRRVFIFLPDVVFQIYMSEVQEERKG